MIGCQRLLNVIRKRKNTSGLHFFYKVILPTPHLASISKASLDFESVLALAIFQFSVDPIMMLDPHESTLMVSIRSITQEVCLG